jgi:hypothetical protein
VVVDRIRLEGSVDFVGVGSRRFTSEEGTRFLGERAPHEKLAPHPALPEDTRLWAVLQQLGGGTWGGCVYDVPSILQGLRMS